MDSKDLSFKKYRLIWNDDGGELGCYPPPVGVDKLKKIIHDRFEGTAVDAFFCALAPCAGYTTAYPTRLKDMDFIIDKYNSGARLGGIMGWQYAENLQDLMQQKVDWIEFQMNQARQLGMDFWLHLRMNDWHHSDDNMGEKINLLAGRFYVEHHEFLIGKEAVKDLSCRPLQDCMAWFQDYAHQEVRQHRLSVLEEAAERYDIDGFQYDFMRCPGYFKPGQEQAGMPKMTEFIRESRSTLDRIGKNKGKRLGFSVRVPNTISGSEKLGLDIQKWIREGLVDLVVPSTFYHVDPEEDMAEWMNLTKNTSVGIYPAIEAAYSANHTGGVVRCAYSPPVMLPITNEMSCAIAARHYRNKVDGLYLFNWTRTPALLVIGDKKKLACSNKTYVLMRRDDLFPNCLPLRQIPIRLSEQPSKVVLTIADDLLKYRQRLSGVKMWVHYTNLTNRDKIEVKVNGTGISRFTSKGLVGEELYTGMFENWLIYDLMEHLPITGSNEIEFRIGYREPRVAVELPIEVVDLELRIEYLDK
jgi:hypothetical protein